MDSTNSIMFEMKVLQDLRKMSPEQRKELLSAIEQEEQLEQEALKKNPNMHLERQLKQVLAELKDIRNELQTYKNNNICIKQQCPLETITQQFDECNSDECEEYSLFSMDMLPFWIFLLFVILSLFMPTKPQHIRPFSI